MSYTLQRNVTANDFTDAATLVCPNSRVAQLTVLNNAVEIQTGKGHPGIVWQDPPSYKLPGVWTIPGPFDAIRARSATKNVPAQVAADAW